MSVAAVVWVTTRDGSIHATKPPIIASGQPMLCARSFGRLDLRVRAQLRIDDREFATACPVCRLSATPPRP